MKALVCYLHYEAPPDEQNFPMVMEMIRSGDVKEDNEEYQSVLDELFERLEARNPEHIALKYYRAYHSGSAKTLKSIQISLVSRLEKFNLDSLAGITQIDEMELESIGEKKTAVFAVIPDNDSSFNFIVGMLYTQLFQQLYYQADSVHGGRLPVHVHFVMDEFANVALPDEFDKLLSTMRSREISVSIIIQNLAQLKALFEKQYHYIFQCFEFQRSLRGLGNGILIKETESGGLNTIRMRIPSQKLGAQEFPCCSRNEQDKIVAALEASAKKVDTLIANQEAQIDKLKAYKQSLITEVVTKGLDPNVPMKDSGIEWIGLIPKHWNVIATKYLFQIESGATPKSENPDYFDGDIPWITPADYKTEEIFVSGGRRNISELGLKSCSTTLIPRGSLIFSKRAPIGAVAINTEELCTNQGCLSCVPKTEDIVKYYYYVMSVCTEQYNLLGSGTTFKEISATNFANFVVPNPNICEQEKIVAYLDKKCSKVDRLIAIKNAKIDKLNQYKKSLIYEYVTGKKEVM